MIINNSCCSWFAMMFTTCCDGRTQENVLKNDNSDPLKKFYMCKMQLKFLIGNNCLLLKRNISTITSTPCSSSKAHSNTNSIETLLNLTRTNKITFFACTCASIFKISNTRTKLLTWMVSLINETNYDWLDCAHRKVELIVLKDLTSK